MATSEAFLNELLLLFRYPPRSAAAQLDGALPLRYCASRFASKVPTWRLPIAGGVAALVGVIQVESGGDGIDWVGGPGGGGKRFRLNRKTTAHFVQRFFFLSINLGHGYGRDSQSKIIWRVLVLTQRGCVSRPMCLFMTGLDVGNLEHAQARASKKGTKKKRRNIFFRKNKKLQNEKKRFEKNESGGQNRIGVS